MSNRHIAIIGSGVVGLSAAWYCRQRGLDVTIIERGGEDRDCCSLGNAGYICPSHFVPLAAPGMVKMGLKMMGNPESPFYVKPRLSWDLLSWAFRFWRAGTKARVERAAPLLCAMHVASVDCYKQFAAAWNNDFGLTHRGLLMLCKTQKFLDKETHVAEMATKLGLKAEVMDMKAIARLEPNLTMDALGGAIFYDDCHLTPQIFVGSLKKAVAEAGCRFLWNAEVNDFDVRGRRIHSIKTAAGTVEADEVVLAAGAWSPTLSKKLGLSLPMQAGKGYNLTMPNPKQQPEISMILTEARVAVTPMGKTLRFGGTMEMSGLNLDINPARLRGIINSACRYLPAYKPEDFVGIAPWRGLRPCSPDGLPYLGRTKRVDNLTLATGHAMIGMSLGPVTGKHVAEIVTGEKPAYDLGLLDPDRYA